MSQLTSIPDDGCITSQAAASKPRMPWLAALFSLMAPGLGQWYAGRRSRAVACLFIVLLNGTLAIHIVAYWPWEHINVVLGGMLSVSIQLAVAFDAWRVAHRDRHKPRSGYQCWWVYLLVGLAVHLFVSGWAHAMRTFALEGYHVPTANMADTLLPGDRILVDKRRYRRNPIRHGDIVIYYIEGPGSLIFVQRVIGLPGDVIEIRDEVIHRNGEPLDEPYVLFRGPKPSIHESRKFFNVFVDTSPVTVPENEVYLVGDNRRGSEDSRWRGTTPMHDVIGPVVVIYWSSTPPPHQWERPGDDPGYDNPQDGIRWSRFGQHPR